jgi:xanthine dehydrogenase large subunit
MKQTLRIGTRGSALALWQAGWVKTQLEKHWPGLRVELVPIKTSGDKIQDVSLAQVGGKGLFVKEIEEALLAETIDLDEEAILWKAEIRVDHLSGREVAQVVAETFGIDLDQIRVSATSTAQVPNTSPTAASSGSDLNGMAALAAAGEIKARMTEVAAAHFAVPADEIVFSAGRVYAGNRSVAFGELAQMAWEQRASLSATGYYRTPKIHWDFATNSGRPFYYFAYGAAAAEVAVDTLTGESRVLRAELLQDCGHSLNPAIDLGQIEGAFVQGMGWLTTEELWWDAEGRLRTHGPSTYKIPGSRDVPPVFNARILADAPNREETIFRSKAVGEPPLMLAISVFLAIRDAIATLGDGRVPAPLDAPATPERVLAAVDAVRGSR